MALQLELAVITFVTTQPSHKLRFSRSKFWHPQRFHSCATRLPQSVARVGRTRECECLAFGAAVGARNAHVCGHTTVTQTLILAFQVEWPPEVPHLRYAAATSSCACGHTRDCGCLACGAGAAAGSAHVCDHTSVTQTLILAFQIWELSEVPCFCRAAATSSCARRAHT